jgi:hypothetical protein
MVGVADISHSACVALFGYLVMPKRPADHVDHSFEAELTDTDNTSNRVERCADYSPLVRAAEAKCMEEDLASMGRCGSKK